MGKSGSRDNNRNLRLNESCISNSKPEISDWTARTIKRRAIAPPGQEGWTRHQEKYRVASFDGADGVVVQDRQDFLNLN